MKTQEQQKKKAEKGGDPVEGKTDEVFFPNSI